MVVNVAVVKGDYPKHETKIKFGARTPTIFANPEKQSRQRNLGWITS